MNFVAHFEQQRALAGFHQDAAQDEVALHLEDLGTRLITAEKNFNQWFHRIKRSLNVNNPNELLTGIYLWGGVGRGKTLLVDMFYDWLPIDRKRRLHFHRFMQLVHAQLTELEGTSDPLQEIARSFGEQTRLLCFDEFYVSDIGDAMILAELLTVLFEQGLVLVATSNTQPQQLYERGLQRQRFLPAIDLIEQQTLVIEMAGATDYRFEALRQSEIYQIQFPIDETTIAQDQSNLIRTKPEDARNLTINGRKLDPLYHGDGVAGFTFKALCETARNTSDYIELARLFHTVVIYDIPQLSTGLESAARRFVALIDEFYDRRVNTLFYAEVSIDRLYQGAQLKEIFERTISRVIEMQSDEFLTEGHRS